MTSASTSDGHGAEALTCGLRGEPRNRRRAPKQVGPTAGSGRALLLPGRSSHNWLPAFGGSREPHRNRSRVTCRGVPKAVKVWVRHVRQPKH